MCIVLHIPEDDLIILCGQLVIPKAARERFGLTGGQRLIVLSEDNEGIALVPADIFEEKINAFVAGSAVRADE